MNVSHCMLTCYIMCEGVLQKYIFKSSQKWHGSLWSGYEYDCACGCECGGACGREYGCGYGYECEYGAHSCVSNFECVVHVHMASVRLNGYIVIMTAALLVCIPLDDR